MTITPLAAVLGLAVATVVADYFVKRAGQNERVDWMLFTFGTIVYSTTSFGWLYAMRHLKLATIGVYYSLATVLLLALLGTLVFQEPLNRREYLGILLALISLVLLGRFAD